MHAGGMAAYNIHEQLLQQRTGKKPQWMEMPPVPPMIALALGKDAVAWAESSGLHSGPEVMERFFQDDLGLKICTKSIGLDEELESVEFECNSLV